MRVRVNTCEVFAVLHCCWSVRKTTAAMKVQTCRRAVRIRVRVRVRVRVTVTAAN